MSIFDDRVARSLYVHVPFCARKCEYCAFYSEALNGDVVRRYVEALIRELERLPADHSLQTTFFGGGTPSLLTVAQWTAIFQALAIRGLRPAPEWTVECNPATVSLDKAKLWREHGVNRVSMGVQSLDENLLDRLGRVHSRAMVFKSFDILRSAGFDNINIDLMFAIPGQTLETWQGTMTEGLALQSEHLACYEVIYEEDTPLFAQMKAGQFEVDDDLACIMYDALLETTSKAGLVQYEVANFAKNEGPDIWQDGLPGRACRHNANYWRGGNFYGLGPSASSFLGGVRRRNIANTEIYCRRIEQGEPIVESEDRLSAVARAGEIAAFGLRMPQGWEYGTFKATTGFDLRREWSAELAELQERDWGRVLDDRVHLTAEGLRFADSAGEMFLR